LNRRDPAEKMARKGTETVAIAESGEMHLDRDFEMNSTGPVTGSRSSTPYVPVQPDNTPAVLTYSNVSVTTRTNPAKVLLNNVHGSITGGFWAIMGKSPLPMFNGLF
jgi:hypothetical protein